MTKIMTPQENKRSSQQQYMFLKSLPEPIHFPYTRNITYDNVLSNLMGVAYDYGESIQINFLNGSEEEKIINGFLRYVQNPEKVKQASITIGGSMPRKKRETKESVDDFVKDVNFVRKGNSILLVVQESSDSFRQYNLDLHALDQQKYDSGRDLNTSH